MNDFTQGASPKAHPMLFSAPMIRALLAGRKTQTRRIITPQPYDHGKGRWQYKGSEWGVDRIPLGPGLHSPLDFCKWQPGDLLWVREAFGTRADCPSSMVLYQRRMDLCAYRADSPGDDEWCWKPSIHMPRWASRLSLELTDVRVERLQDISEEDAKAEGIFFTDYGRQCFHRPVPWQGLSTRDCTAPPEHHPQRDGWMWDRTTSPDQCLGSARAAYGNLWNTINGPDSWNTNPWVWCLFFRAHKQNVDELLGRKAA